MTQGLAELVESPRLPQIVRELEALLRDESIRRDRFRDRVEEGRREEFVNGEVVVHSPERYEHAATAERIAHLLRTWTHRGPGGVVLRGAVLVALTRNDYMPDVTYFGPAKADLFVPLQATFPAPDLAVEVLSTSTESRDRGIKLEDYAMHGVGEYWIVEPSTRLVEQYRLRDDRFALHTRLASGETLASPMLPGFTVPVDAFFDDTALRNADLSPRSEFR